MSRPLEEEGDRAGAKLVKCLEEAFPTFNCPIMVFTSDGQRGEAMLRQLGVKAAVEIVDGQVALVRSRAVYVTTDPETAVAFAQFSDMD